MNPKESFQKEREAFQPYKEKHPQLLKEIDSWSCGPGWHPILIDLCAVLQNIIDRLPMEIKGEMYIVQIKEKFGTLNVYMNQGTPEIMGAIRMAEYISYRICEDCGAPGRMRHGGWIKVRCDDCDAKEQERKKKDWDDWKEEQRRRDQAKKAAKQTP